MLHVRVSILARPEGRALLRADNVLADNLSVSILARPEGRALPLLFFEGPRSTCFNPRPPRRTGATIEAIRQDLRRSYVSILARPEGRALQR